jgi:hypothetical protein
MLNASWWVVGQKGNVEMNIVRTIVVALLVAPIALKSSNRFVSVLPDERVVCFVTHQRQMLNSPDWRGHPFGLRLG